MESRDKETMNISVKVPKDLHVDCKVKLAREGKTFVSLVIDALERYRSESKDVK